MIQKYSEYQTDIFDFIKYGYGNAVISAVAGSGKSTTIIKCLDYIKPEKKVLFLAFNNSIVEELKTKIENKNVDIKTLHSLGLSIIRYNFKEVKIDIDENKYVKIANQFLSEEGIDVTSNKGKVYKDNVKKLINFGRICLCKNEKQLIAVANKYNIILVDNEIDIVLKILSWAKTSIDETKSIDFNDMTYLPNILNLKTPKYDFIFIDEAQDLSKSQLELFLKCFKHGGRFIAVGDEKQIIYSFSGADVDSFTKLKNIPQTTQLPLSVCYRCPKKIIDLAKNFVEEIESFEFSIDGEIKENATIFDIKDGDMVICRNSEPLVNIYIELLSNNKKAYIKGKQIGDNLLELLNQTNKEELNVELKKVGVISDMYYFLYKYKNQLINTKQISENDVIELDEYVRLEENINILKKLSLGLENKTQLINKITKLFISQEEDNNGVCLSTIHKAKGLENDNVFILNKFLMENKKDSQEELNLQYVAITRAKKKLFFLNRKIEKQNNFENNLNFLVEKLYNLK